MEWREINNSAGRSSSPKALPAYSANTQGRSLEFDALVEIASTLVEVQEKLEALVGKLGIELADAADTGAAVISGDDQWRERRSQTTTLAGGEARATDGSSAFPPRCLLVHPVDEERRDRPLRLEDQRPEPAPPEALRLVHSGHGWS